MWSLGWKGSPKNFLINIFLNLWIVNLFYLRMDWRTTSSKCSKNIQTNMKYGRWLCVIWLFSDCLFTLWGFAIHFDFHLIRTPSQYFKPKYLSILTQSQLRHITAAAAANKMECGNALSLVNYTDRNEREPKNWHMTWIPWNLSSTFEIDGLDHRLFSRLELKTQKGLSVAIQICFLKLWNVGRW